MTERIVLAAFLFIVLALIWIWSLCMAVKMDVEEAKRDNLSADPTADPFHLRGPRD